MKILLVKKEKGITSFDVTKKVQRLLNASKVGHTGTLDPLAEGLMMLTIDSATKLLPYIVTHTKEYICEMKLGYKTDTLDCEGTIIENKEPLSHEIIEIKKVLNSFLGEQKQTPPMYSAKKIKGKKLYDLAREGKIVERKACDINIYDIELLSYENNIIRYRVCCSAGTYIRVLCEDIAFKLNEIATMISLIRTKIDKYSIEQAYSIKDIENNCFTYLDAYEVLNNYKYIEYEKVQDIYNGKAIKINAEEQIVMITHNHEIIAAYQKDNDNLFHCLRGLW